MYENPEMCSRCGGKCCKTYPGINFPEDFNLPNSNFLAASLRSGKYTIDWWEGDPRDDISELLRSCVVRPAVKGKEGMLYDPSWGGECTFLSSSGCVLLAEERPRECRELEPMKTLGEKCMSHVCIKKDASIAWIQYQEVLLDVVRDIERHE